MLRKIEKDIKRSVGILEIIHTDICGPFPVESVDGYDSFIIFIQLREDQKHWINLRYLRLK
jgi:hypothetical protein